MIFGIWDIWENITDLTLYKVKKKFKFYNFFSIRVIIESNSNDLFKNTVLRQFKVHLALVSFVTILTGKVHKKGYKFLALILGYQSLNNNNKKETPRIPISTNQN